MTDVRGDARLLETATCPVLAFTPEVEEAHRWFFATHERTEQGWRRTALPEAGGYGDQDSLRMSMIECVQGVLNERLASERAALARRRSDAAGQPPKDRRG